MKNYQHKYYIKNSLINEIGEIRRLVNPVIQTIYDILKAHEGELKVETIEDE